MATPQERFEASLARATSGITYSPGQLRSLTNIGNYSRASAAERTKMANPFVPRRPKPAPRRPKPDPEPDDVTTNGVTQPFRYSPTLPALTPEQQRALMERRRLATRSFEDTQAVVDRERDRAEAEALRQQGEVERLRELQSRAGMQTLAGRGVGRSPIFVNPFQRQLAEQSQRQVGELQAGLANTLAQLGSALRQAETGRERELAQIDFDAVDFRSDVGRLLGA